MGMNLNQRNRDYVPKATRQSGTLRSLGSLGNRRPMSRQSKRLKVYWHDWRWLGALGGVLTAVAANWAGIAQIIRAANGG
jgi:hypothetical protein